MAARGLGGWRIIDGWRLAADRPPFDVMLVHPAFGVALMELEPHWTAEAERLLRARLAAAGFPDRYPGHLPIIHRRLRPVNLPELPALLAEAFSWQDPLTIPPELDWVEGFCAALGVAGTAPAAAPITAGGAANTHSSTAVPADDAATADPVAGQGTATAPRRTGGRLAMGAAAVAATLALAVLLDRPVDSPHPAPPPQVPVAGPARLTASTLTPPDTAETPMILAAAPSPEPDPPRLEAVLRALARPPEPLAPFPEPDPPRLEPVLRALARPPEPLAPFPEPDPPQLEPVLRALAAPPPPASPPAAAPLLPAATLELLLRRGAELLRIGDVSGARRFFERAAEAGSGEAALAAGGTYDPRELARLGARGIPPDRAAALAWYRRAAALGVAEAEARIRALETLP